MAKKLTTITEVESEIERVQTAIAKTNSKHLRHDYNKYLKKLFQRRREIRRNIQVDKLLEEYHVNRESKKNTNF